VPYYISSKILFHLAAIRFKTAVIMLQKEFVDKIFAQEGTKEFGRLSMMAGLYFGVTRAFTVGRGNFMPMPKHDSAVIVLTRRKIKTDPVRDELINLLFQQKKKTIGNSVKLLLRHYEMESAYPQAAEKCLQKGIDFHQHFHKQTAAEILELAGILRKELKI